MAPQRASSTDLRVSRFPSGSRNCAQKAVSRFRQTLRGAWESGESKEEWQKERQSLGWKYDVQTTRCFPRCAISGETLDLSDLHLQWWK